MSGSAAAPPAPELVSQAEHIWRFLDQLADSDPDAYKAFIEQKMQEHKQSGSGHSSAAQPSFPSSSSPPALFYPEPVFVLYGQQLQPALCPVFINVCASSQVQPILLRHSKQPASTDDIQIMSGLLIPLSVGKQRTETTDSSQPVAAVSSSLSSSFAFNYDCLRALTAAMPSSLPPPLVPSPAHPALVYDVVFNPATLSAASRSLPLLLSLVQLCVSHIQEDNPPAVLHPHPVPVLGLRYRGRQQQQQSEQTATAAASKAKTKAASATASREILLPTSAKDTAAPAITELKLREEKETDSQRRRGGRPLIEEVAVEEGGAATAGGGEKAVPQYEERYDDAAGVMLVDVLLPEVREMGEVSVELGERQLLLSSAAYALTVRLQRAVDEDSCTAKWSSKRRRLTLRARLRPP